MAGGLDAVRGRLIVPVASAVTGVWVLAGVAALYTGRVEVFALASGPFLALCTFCFGVSLTRGRGE